MYTKKKNKNKRKKNQKQNNNNKYLKIKENKTVFSNVKEIKHVSPRILLNTF